MGLFGPSPEPITRGGMIVGYRLRCKRGKCRNLSFEGKTESACKSEYRKHQRLHDNAVKAKKNLEKLKSKRNKNEKCDKCGKKPCSMVKRQCIQEAIKYYPSSMDLDMSDPAYFDPQMRDWFS